MLRRSLNSRMVRVGAELCSAPHSVRVLADGLAVRDRAIQGAHQRSLVARESFRVRCARAAAGSQVMKGAHRRAPGPIGRRRSARCHSLRCLFRACGRFSGSNLGQGTYSLRTELACVSWAQGYPL